MTTIYEIPLSGAPQSFAIALPVASSDPPVAGQYRLLFQYRATEIAGGCGWVVDIFDSNGDPLLCGVPLITGADLLNQFAYLNMGGAFYVLSDGVPEAVPIFDNLGSGSHLYWVTEP